MNTVSPSLFSIYGGANPPGTYYMGDTRVAPAVAVNPATAGATYGGQGMGLPKGATMKPAGFGTGAANLISGLGDAYQQYAAAETAAKTAEANIPMFEVRQAQFVRPTLSSKLAIA